MATKRLYSVRDEVVINVSKKADAVTEGMLEYNGMTTTVSKACRAISRSRKKDLEWELKELRKILNDPTGTIPDNYEFWISDQLSDDEIGAFVDLLEDDPKKALALEIRYRTDMLVRLWTVYGYELKGVKSKEGVPFTFTSDMLSPVVD